MPIVCLTTISSSEWSLGTEILRWPAARRFLVSAVAQIDGESLLSDEKAFDELHSLFEVGPRRRNAESARRVGPAENF